MIQRLLTHLRAAGAELPVWESPLQTLRAIHRSRLAPTSPVTGLRAPWQFTASNKADPTLLSELRRELTSADQVDVLVSFITWSGLRKLWDVLEAATTVGANGIPQTRLRVLTTTYTGATEARAPSPIRRQQHIRASEVNRILHQSANGLIKPNGDFTKPTFQLDSLFKIEVIRDQSYQTNHIVLIRR